jgi:RNA polymerase sigma-70 factor (ECF subfamily)
MGEESSDEKFDALYRANYARVHRLARRLVGADNADDVTQEVMIRALRHIHLLDPARPVWPWLAAVTQNASMDHHRRQRGDLPTNAADIERLTAPSEDVAAQVLRSDARARLSRALGRMPAFDRLLLTRHEMEGVPVAAIARSLGESPNALRQRLFRARRVLARHYRQLGGQYAWASPHLTARLAARRSRCGVSRPGLSARAAASFAVGGLLAGSTAVAPAGLPAPEAQVRRPAAVAAGRHRPEDRLTTALGPVEGALASSAAAPADRRVTVPAIRGPHVVTRIDLGFDGGTDYFDYMVGATRDCTGPTQAGPCALGLDSARTGVTFACASRDRSIPLGTGARLSFYFLGDPDRVDASVEAALSSGAFRLYLPDASPASGITLHSNRADAVLPPWAGAGPGWHLVTLDLDPGKATLTLTVDGATATVPLNPGVSAIRGLQLVGDPWGTAAAGEGDPSAARIDSLVIETADARTEAVRHDDPVANKTGLVARKTGCPVAVDGGRVKAGVPDLRQF